MKTQDMPTSEFTLRFKAQAGGELAVPPDILGKLPKQDGLILEGTANGFPFRAEMGLDGKLQLSPALRDAIGGKPGQEIDVELTRFGEEPEVRIPSDLLQALEGSERAGALWKVVTPMARREWVRWIASAKQPQTREKRIEVGIDKLEKGMRRPCCFPGLNFVTKDLVAPDETWAPLPK